MARARKRLGVLISGSGTNLQALIEACQAPDYPAEITLVLSNKPNAGGLAKAAAAGVANEVIPHKEFSSRDEFDAALDARLQAAGVDLICNAGFMRLHGRPFVERWRDRQMNIHPSLLPSFPGLHAHEQALAAGVRISGCTVHFMRYEMDSGPIIGQAAIPVSPDDDVERLSARILAAEHKLYPHCVRLAAEGRLEVRDEIVHLDGAPGRGCLFSPDPGAAAQTRSQGRGAL